MNDNARASVRFDDSPDFHDFAGLTRAPPDPLSAVNGLGPVFEKTYFMFFPDFKKHDFLRFFEMSFQKVSSLLNVCRNLASKLPDVMCTYRHLSHTVLSCIVSCVHASFLRFCVFF